MPDAVSLPGLPTWFIRVAPSPAPRVKALWFSRTSVIHPLPCSYVDFQCVHLPCHPRSSRAYPARSTIGLCHVRAGLDTLTGPHTGIEGEARMRQETLGLSRFLQLVRRAWTAVGEVAVVTLVAGIVFAVLHPPVLTSTATVLLAPQLQSTQAATSNGAPDPYTATEEVIADSNPVLAAALPAVRPAMSRAELRGDVRIGSPNSPLITVTAKGRVAADAEATANAVASSYIGYVNSAGNPAGHEEAVMLELATSATGRSWPVWLLIVGGFSALYGAIAGAIGALVFGWSDRRRRISR